MSKEKYEEWVYKCMKCKYSYWSIRDNDVMYCRKRKGKCEFKPKEKRKNGTK